jgi:hypothetical protein
VAHYGDGNHTLSEFIKVIDRSAEKKHLLFFKKFVATHRGATGAERSMDQILEQLENNLEWLKRDKKDIENFFR